MKFKALVLAAMCGIAMQNSNAVENNNNAKPFYKKASTWLYGASALCGMASVYSFWKFGGAWPCLKNCPPATSTKQAIFQKLPGATLGAASIGLVYAARNPEKVGLGGLD
ncbi:hypothetical protein HYX58_06230 [Candidatus Dependentiae bacterium]|nr:hypothetical protein [Candidatus Dependentiae bacterium]